MYIHDLFKHNKTWWLTEVMWKAELFRERTSVGFLIWEFRISKDFTFQCQINTYFTLWHLCVCVGQLFRWLHRTKTLEMLICSIRTSDNFFFVSCAYCFDWNKTNWSILNLFDMEAAAACQLFITILLLVELCNEISKKTVCVDRNYQQVPEYICWSMISSRIGQTSWTSVLT